MCSSLGTHFYRGPGKLVSDVNQWLGSIPIRSLHKLRSLEQIPKELVVDFVVILHLGRFDESTQLTRTAVRRSLFEISIAPLHVRSEKGRGPFSLAKVVERRINVVR